MRDRVAVFVTWQELFDEVPVEREILDVVRLFNRESALVLLSRLGIYLFVDQFRDIKAETVRLQAFLISNFFDQEVLKRLRARMSGATVDFRRCFHSQQILALLRLVIVHSLPVGGTQPDADPEARNALGRCLLKTNDLLMSHQMSAQLAQDRKNPRSPQRYLRLQLVLGAGTEIFNPPTVPTSIVRSQIIFEEIAKRVGASVDLSSLLEQQAGISLDSYVDLIFGVLAGYMSRKPQQLIDDAALAVFNPVTFFGSSIPKETTDRFWSMESVSIDELARTIAAPSALVPDKDFTAFRMKPFVRLQSGSVICAHPGFIQEKLEIGLFWTIVNNLEGEVRQKVFDTWGKLFETYVNETLGNTAKAGREEYFPVPEYKGKKHQHEAFDGMLVSDTVCVAIECKGGFLPNIAKYADDLRQFERNLDKKFGTEKGAGVEQLARKIGHLFAAKREEERELQNIDLSRVKIVVPVLVVQDNFVSSMFTTPWLAKSFRDLMRKQALTKRVVLTSLLVLHVEDIESVQNYMQRGAFKLSDCFLYAGKSGDPGVSRVFGFSDVFRDFLQDRGVGPINHQSNARFHDIVDRITMRFFNRPLES